MTLWPPIGLLADTNAPPELVDSIRTAFRSGGKGHDLWLFTAATLAVVVLLGIIARLSRKRRPSAAAQRVDYLAVAVERLGLGPAQRRDIQRLAAGAKLSYPVFLLLSPANLAHGLASLDGEQHDPEFAARIAELATVLFGAPLPDAGQPSDARDDRHFERGEESSRGARMG
jgi:hypothetical protein